MEESVDASGKLQLATTDADPEVVAEVAEVDQHQHEASALRAGYYGATPCFRSCAGVAG